MARSYKMVITLQQRARSIGLSGLRLAPGIFLSPAIPMPGHSPSLTIATTL